MKQLNHDNIINKIKFRITSKGKIRMDKRKKDK